MRHKSIKNAEANHRNKNMALIAALCPACKQASKQTNKQTNKEQIIKQTKNKAILIISSSGKP